MHEEIDLSNATLAELKQRLADQQQEIAMLEEVGLAISGELEVDRVLQVVADSACKLAKAKTVLIPLLNADCTTYTYAAGSGENTEEIVGEKLPLEMGICGWVWKNKRAWWRGVLDELSEQERTHWEKEAGSVLLVPLIGKDHFLGGLAAIDKITGEEFDERDLKLLSMFASQVSIAIEKAGLFAELEQARKEAEDASNAKSMFLAMMSHELRTPLGSVIGYCDVLNEDLTKGKPVQPEFINKISKAGYRLLRLINDLLDFTSDGGIKNNVVLEEILIGDLVVRLTKEVGGFTESANITLQAPEVKANDIMIGDFNKLYHLLYHLLSNAYKFTEIGKVNFTVERFSQMDSDWIRFSVADTGPGIAEANHMKIFEPFVQIEDTLTRVHGGVGLGLGIVKQYCDMMNGTIQIKSSLGQGSTFIVELPVNRS